jgi:hypothetical protein
MVTAEAFAIIVAALPEGYKAEPSPDGNGGFVVSLPNGILDRLEVLRALRELQRRDFAAGVEGVRRAGRKAH